ALVLNADTVQIARALINDQNLRTSITAAAQTSSSSLQSQVTGTTDAQASAVQGGTTAQADQGSDATTVQETYKQLASLSLPIGWSFTPVDATQAQAQIDAGMLDPYQDAQNAWNMLPLGNPSWLGNLIVKIIGWVLTAIAVAQGAPFWFDLLRRLTGGGGGSQGGTTTVSAPVNVTTPPVTVNVGAGYTNGDGGTAAKPAEPPPQLETWPIPSEMPPMETTIPAGTGDEEGAVG
ncbi:MAG: hypothetical protein K8I60_02320, partial [Anaerolineae bacterium]|nr:hypothetical protein [Anaerolineae bacterium]